MEANALPLPTAVLGRAFSSTRGHLSWFSGQDNLMGLVDTASLAFKSYMAWSPLSGADLKS